MVVSRTVNTKIAKITLNTSSVAIQNVSKSDFLLMCEKYYNDTVNRTTNNDKYINTYETFKQRYPNITKDILSNIRTNIDSLQAIVGEFVSSGEGLDSDSKIMITDKLLSFFGNSYNSTHELLNELDFDEYVEVIC